MNNRKDSFGKQLNPKANKSSDNYNSPESIRRRERNRIALAKKYRDLNDIEAIKTKKKHL